KMGRAHVYIPILNKHTFAKDHLSIIQRVFSGNSVDLVSYLINKNDINLKDLEEIQMIINKKKELMT
ncbi:MAG TPA: BlaI/MecI/CopY family transcriptional regulator, partial [Gammaproteobacteria bacterium]|nr:BlaI/MecI/CopY family transcriptional regulator [Gammaproteobacteria bacterium]